MTVGLAVDSSILEILISSSLQGVLLAVVLPWLVINSRLTMAKDIREISEAVGRMVRARSAMPRPDVFLI